ncbi:MAG TPA: FAD-binding oxidoreductase [Candidatus Syntrophoarchaeum butanivorans]|uniref:FAD-binding oxidoreductase n=1 Tax=Candidatus Syntropharchaeum butanivorans TaxID=1839936 RepID=A0A7C1B7F2_9EURY|nr:FAD-binding oxidoreductase [Candidatus Syntrophoarchaeum butanivorans]
MRDNYRYDEEEVLDRLSEILPQDAISRTPADLYCYSRDASYIKPERLPFVVIRPRSREEVAGVVRIGHDMNVPITPRGAASGLTGGAVPLYGGIVLDMTGMDRILDIDPENMQVLLEPGVVHARLNETLSAYGLFFPPDPGSSEMCTIGGMIANNASGMRSVKYGTTSSYVLELEVVLPTGEIITTGSRCFKTSSGYDLKRLFVGSEGTLGVVTGARLRLGALPDSRVLILASFRMLEDAGKGVVKVLRSGIRPSAAEILDEVAVHAVKLGDSPLIIFELDGDEHVVRMDASRVIEVCEGLGAECRVIESESEQAGIWDKRRMVGVVITRHKEGSVRVYEGEDVIVPINQVVRMLREIQRISDKFGIEIITYGHIGDGNLHTAMAIDVRDQSEWERLFAMSKEIYTTALRLGGSLTGEHGIGVIRAGYMEQEHRGAFGLMQRIKQAIDPGNIMNPGKMGFK